MSSRPEPDLHLAVGWFGPSVIRRTGITLVAVTSLFSGAIIWLSGREHANATELLGAQLSHSVAIRAEVLRREIEGVRGDVLVLAQLAHVTQAAPADWEVMEESLAQFCAQKSHYHQLRYLGSDGKEQVRVECDPLYKVPDHELQPKGDRYYFREARALTQGQVFVSRFDLNIEHGQVEIPHRPMIRLAAPVYSDDDLVGVIVINYLGDDLLQQLDDVAMGHPGRGDLFDAEGYLITPSADDHGFGFMFDGEPDAPRRLGDVWDTMRLTDVGAVTDSTGIYAWERVRPASGDGSVIAVSTADIALLHQAVWSRLALPTTIAGVCLLLLVGLSWRLSRDGEQRRVHERQLERSQRRLKSLSLLLIDAQEHERQRISRELHDELGQWMTALHLTLQRAEASDDRREALIAESIRLLEELIDRTHAIATAIRPALLDDLGLSQATRSLVADWARRTGVHASVNIEIFARPLASRVREHVYRILQESLTNISKHAQATKVTVELVSDERELRLQVRDNGVGIHPGDHDRGRLGILGMMERADILGGRLSVDHADGGGTVVDVLVPEPCAKHDPRTSDPPQ